MLGYSIDENPHFIDAAEKAYYAIFENEGTAQKPPVQQPNQQQTAPVPPQQQQQTSQNNRQPNNQQSQSATKNTRTQQQTQALQPQQNSSNNNGQSQVQQPPQQQNSNSNNGQSNEAKDDRPWYIKIAEVLTPEQYSRLKARFGTKPWDKQKELWKENFSTPNQDIIKDYLKGRLKPTDPTYIEAMKWAVKQDAINQNRMLAVPRNAYEKEMNKRSLERDGIKRNH